MDAGTSRSKAIKLKKINLKWETRSGEVKGTVQVRKMRKMKRRENSLVSGLINLLSYKAERERF